MLKIATIMDWLTLGFFLGMSVQSIVWYGDEWLAIGYFALFSLWCISVTLYQILEAVKGDEE